MKRKQCFLLGLLFLISHMIPTTIVFSKTILGQSCALTGPTSFLGTEMNKGAKAYFSRYATDIELRVKDDGYEPDRCRANTKQFIKDGVNALFGYVGTPTSKVAVPLATQSKTIYFGAFTGASFLSDIQTNPYSFSVRSSYNAEIENMIRHLKEDLGFTRIGLFVQRDAFGMAGILGALRAEKLIEGIQIIPAVPPIPADDASEKDWNTFWQSVPNYRRNTVSVGKGVRQIRGNAVEAVILVGAYRPCAAAINQWHKLGFNGPMINISFVGSIGLAQRLKKTDNVYISQVVPDPWDSTIPVVRNYHYDLKDGKYGFVSLEGYLAAKIFHHAVQTITTEINSDSIKLSLEAMNQYDAGGLTLSFSTNDHQGMDEVYLTTIAKSGNIIKFNYVNKLTVEQ